MSMESGPERPLYVSDILEAARHGETPDDVAEYQQALHETITDNAELSVPLEEAPLFMRKVSNDILGLLELKGVDDSLELENQLRELDNLTPNRPLRADMVSLANYYTAKQSVAPDFDIQKEYKRLAATAWATAGVVNFEAARRVRSDSTMLMFRIAEEMIAEAGADIPDVAQQALVGVLVELRAGLHG